MKINFTLAVVVFCLIRSVLSEFRGSIFYPAQSVGWPSTQLDLINRLHQRLIESQVPQDESYSWLHWEKKRGLWPSEVRMNFHGKPEMRLLRDEFEIFDNNMFITTWISEILLECGNLGTVSVSDDILFSALQTMQRFKDRNQDKSSISPAFVFWEQIDIDGTFVAWPTNLKQVMNDTEGGVTYIQWLLEELDLGWLWNDIAPQVQEMVDMATSFRIPGDIDDSTCMLGLGSLIASQKDALPKTSKLFRSLASDISQLASEMVTYAYRPFSNDISQNTIDPRSYYFLHPFLQQRASQPNASLILFPTWLMDIDMNRRSFSKGVAMPFNINNIDMSVNANAIYGITSHIISSGIIPSWFSEDFEQGYIDGISMIEWAISSRRIIERPDLALLYYPPIFDFFWFTARSVHILNSDFNFQLEIPAVKFAKDRLTRVMRNEATQMILNFAKTDPNSGFLFWDDFLGQADISFLGNPEPHYDDRVFSTAVALNALYDTWTVKKNQSLEWAGNTPANIASTLQSGIEYLKWAIYSEEPKLYNSFFSGSVKSIEQMPFFFPANFMQFLNGTNLPPNPADLSAEVIIGMSGVVSEDVYADMINASHFGFPTPVNFTGYNVASFPFWSSDALTESVVMLALSKSYRLVNGM